MPRSEKDLKELLQEIKKWFQDDMGVPYNLDLISEPLKNLAKTRIEKFIRRRLDHLPDPDLIKFIEVCTKDALPPPIVEPKVEVARGKSTKR